jgi:hypothetical protein
MPIPDTNGLPPFATFEDTKTKMNEIVQKYNNLLVNLDSLNVVSLTAQTITSGTIDANKVTIRSDLQGGGFVTIDGNGLTINNGSIDTFKTDLQGNITATSATIVNDLTGTGSVSISNAGIVVNNGSTNTFSVDVNGNVNMTSATIFNDLAGSGTVSLSNGGIVVNNGTFNTFTVDTNGLVTMTAALIQSATGYPRVELNSATNLVGAALNATNSINIVPNLFGAPAIDFTANGNRVGQINSGVDNVMRVTSSFTHLALQSQADINVLPFGQMKFNGWAKVYDNNTGQNLQEALNAAGGGGASGQFYVSSSISSFVGKEVQVTNGRITTIGP